MKSLTEHLWFNTSKRIEFVNITDKVEEIVKKSGIQEGLALVNAMHITASVFINDNESGLMEDYKDNLTGEDNAYAHLMRTIMGREVVIAITNGKLDFGPWEQVFYLELDGQRKKRVFVKVIGE